MCNCVKLVLNIIFMSTAKLRVAIAVEVYTFIAKLLLVTMI